MDTLLSLKALIMGIVEGLTEFLPISSTGHLILAGSVLNFTSPTFPKEKVDVFEIVIQAGAILAVCWEYRIRIALVLSGLFSDRKAQRLAINLIVAFLPAAVLGVLFSKAIKAHLFSAVPVATAFIVGGLIILWVERRHARLGDSLDNRANRLARVDSIDDMTVVDALKIGCAQAFALIPGTSRSGATIIGGMMFGLSRQVATEFSFFLAIPTLLGATVYSLYKARAVLDSADMPLLTVGTIAAFLSAFICVRWLLRYIGSHDFTLFAWYRIAFGILILATAYYGLVVWAD
ncbi:MAG: pyrophosphate phosphatase [Herbaspirillum sp.]|nr:pyrophosphate phosphatase [Herbaspirillum sp.]